MLSGILNDLFGFRKNVQVCTKEFDAIITYHKSQGSNPQVTGIKGERRFSTSESIYEENTSMTKFRHEIERDREQNSVAKREVKERERQEQAERAEQERLEALKPKVLTDCGEIMDRYNVSLFIHDDSIDDKVRRCKAVKYKVKGIDNLLDFVTLTESSLKSKNIMAKYIDNIKEDTEFEIVILDNKVFNLHFVTIDTTEGVQIRDYCFVGV